MSGSAVYHGFVSHSRRSPVSHRLRYPITLPLLDLDEVPELFARHRLWSDRRPAPVRFRARDFLRGPGGEGPRDAASLAARARALVAERTGSRPDGPVLLLASPRLWGVGFNPVSFFFCMDESGERTEAAIAEVTNTPWGERHSYVAARTRPDGPIVARLGKRLHVSPYNPMEQTYELRIGEPGPSLAISIGNDQAGDRVFGAGLELRRHPLSRREMTRLAARPPQTLATLARIYSHGLKLRLKGAPAHSHPGAQASTT
ncbi:MAG: DUF1365 domain-containing protein [Solirubrobacterales bacterium]